MFKINRLSNRIELLKEESFKDLGFRERQHIQEWICNTPNCLGEELLIIQKEFDGFNDTRERLDLLALDKQSNIVIIENKLDDSGRDVTWQSLKYASYCSTLTKDQIKDIFQQYLDKTSVGSNAEEKLSEFFNGVDYEELSLNQSQRIILIAAKFRKEVTSTVIWLLNYKIRLQCFKITPYSMGNDLLLSIEQILPVQETEDLSIKISNKLQEDIESQEVLKERHHIRLKFWKQFIEESNKKISLFQNNNPSKENWIASGLGMSGITIEGKISQKSNRVEIYINRGSKEENERIFDLLLNRKDQIESQINLPNKIVWDRGVDKVTCAIKYETLEFNVFNPEDWKGINSFLINGFEQMEKVFKKEIELIKKKI